jgi:hypothetical protein
MRSMWIGTFVALLVSFAGVASAGGPAGNWVLLGTRTVGANVEVDTIPVGADRGQFDRLYVRVMGNALNILDMRVNYTVGADEDIPLRAIIPAGGSSRVIDLRGGDRRIAAIRLTYQKITVGGPATVEVFGQR